MLRTTLLFVKHLNVSIFVQGLEKRIFFRLSHNERHKHMHFKSIVAKKRLRHTSYHNITQNSRSLLSNWEFLTEILKISELIEKRWIYLWKYFMNLWLIIMGFYRYNWPRRYYKVFFGMLGRKLIWMNHPVLHVLRHIYVSEVVCKGTLNCV